MEFCDQSWNSYQCCPQIALNLYFLVNTKKLSTDLKSLHFPMFSAKCRKFKIGERNGHGKSRNGHGKFMEKYFVKSVGTLIMVELWAVGVGTAELLSDSLYLEPSLLQN